MIDDRDPNDTETRETPDPPSTEVEQTLEQVYREEAGGDATAPRDEAGRFKGKEGEEKPKDERRPEPYSALRKREERLRRQTERKFAEREKAIADRERAAEAQARELARYAALHGAKSMRERAELAGIDLEKLADEVVGRTTTEDAREVAAAEVRRLEAERLGREKAARDAETKNAEAVRQSAERSYLSESAQRESIVEMARSGEWDDDDVLRMSYRVGNALLKELGRAPTNAEVLDKIEERANRYLGKHDMPTQQIKTAPRTRTLPSGGGSTGKPAAEDDFDPNDRNSVAAYLMRAARSPQ